MSNRIFQLELAGHPLRLSFLYPETKRFLGRYLALDDGGGNGEIRISPLEWERMRSLLAEEATQGYVEFRCLPTLLSAVLLRFGCCILHGVSFVWEGRAYVLTAPSGTGKTTQFLNWQRLFPGEITMICGDMPVLEARDDGSVWVHPSPWNGKEKLGSTISAPLAGLVVLRQADDNRIEPLTVREALAPLFTQFVVRLETEEQIRALSRLMEQMLRSVPAWKLSNLGDDASTLLLRETLKRREHDGV